MKLGAVLDSAPLEFQGGILWCGVASRRVASAVRDSRWSHCLCAREGKRCSRCRDAVIRINRERPRKLVRIACAARRIPGDDVPRPPIQPEFLGIRRLADTERKRNISGETRNASESVSSSRRWKRRMLVAWERPILPVGRKISSFSTARRIPALLCDSHVCFLLRPIIFARKKVNPCVLSR